MAEADSRVHLATEGAAFELIYLNELGGAVEGVELTALLNLAASNTQQ